MNNGKTTKDALLAELAAEMDRVEREFLDRVAEVPGAAVHHVHDEYVITCPPGKVEDVGRLLERLYREGQHTPHLVTAFPKDPPTAKPVPRSLTLVDFEGPPYRYRGAACGTFHPSPLAAGFIKDVAESTNPPGLLVGACHIDTHRHGIKATQVVNDPPTIMPIIAVTETTRIRHRNHHGGQ